MVQPLVPGGLLLHGVRAKGETHPTDGSRTGHSDGRLGVRTRAQLMVLRCHIDTALLFCCQTKESGRSDSLVKTD